MCNKKKRVSVSLSQSVIDNLNKLSENKGISKSAIVTIALENFEKGTQK